MIITAEKREGLAEIYNQLIDIVGIENTEKIYKNLKGQQITFPMRLYRTEYISRMVNERYDGKNLKALAREYGYTERYLRYLLNKASTS